MGLDIAKSDPDNALEQQRALPGHQTRRIQQMIPSIISVPIDRVIRAQRAQPCPCPRVYTSQHLFTEQWRPLHIKFTADPLQNPC